MALVHDQGTSSEPERQKNT